VVVDDDDGDVFMLLTMARPFVRGADGEWDTDGGRSMVTEAMARSNSTSSSLSSIPALSSIPVVDDHTQSVRATHIGVGDIGTHEAGTPEVRTCEVSALEVGVLEAGALEVGAPKVSYREAPTKGTAYDYKHKKQTGGAAFKHVVIVEWK
jgi:hypothetical protein